MDWNVQKQPRVCGYLTVCLVCMCYTHFASATRHSRRHAAVSLIYFCSRSLCFKVLQNFLYFLFCNPQLGKISTCWCILNVDWQCVRANWEGSKRLWKWWEMWVLFFFFTISLCLTMDVKRFIITSQFWSYVKLCAYCINTRKLIIS